MRFLKKRNILKELEIKENLNFPDIYKTFYESCLKKTPTKMIGSDLVGEEYELLKWAIQLLEENQIDNFLEANDFVFMMHQGYMFWYFKADGTPNPDVFYYREGKSKPEREFPLSEFIRQYPNRLKDFTDKTMLWANKIDFYNSLIHEYNWDIKPMIELIEQLKIASICNDYFPCNSHSALGLKNQLDDYEQNQSTVFIEYMPDQKDFSIHYQKTSEKTEKTDRFQLPIPNNVIMDIKNWL